MYILTPSEMNAVDGKMLDTGKTTWELMLAAGRAVAGEALSRFSHVPEVAVLCGPGKNGGDGYMAAQYLSEAGLNVRIYAYGTPKVGSDAANAARRWKGAVHNVTDLQPHSEMLVIDALFGAGISRPLEEKLALQLISIGDAGAAVVAIDLPSGVCGRSGRVLGVALKADCTVTFFRKKPGHLLYPGRRLCEEVVLADIGIPASILDGLSVSLRENGPELWTGRLPRPSATAHKYARGHVAVYSGPAESTGAARLSAQSAARSGAGAVTLLAPHDALPILAAHLTSIMLQSAETADHGLNFLRSRKVTALICGPGFGTGNEQAAVIDALLSGNTVPMVLDADAISLMAGQSMSKLSARGSETLVLTPHEGEFARLFPQLSGNEALSKVDRARQAAELAQAVVIYKGADTVIAAPDGRAVINGNGTVWLATAGSGDVLAGLVAGLIAQGMPPFEASCAAVWVHAEAGAREGFGMMAEDLPQMIRTVLAELIERVSNS